MVENFILNLPLNLTLQGDVRALELIILSLILYMIVVFFNFFNKNNVFSKVYLALAISSVMALISMHILWKKYADKEIDKLATLDYLIERGKVIKGEGLEMFIYKNNCLNLKTKDFEIYDGLLKSEAYYEEGKCEAPIQTWKCSKNNSIKYCVDKLAKNWNEIIQ